MTATSTASRKAKGRWLQNRIRDDIINRFCLSGADVRSTSMGAAGCDILLSTSAKTKFPFCIECKRQETLKINKWWQQCAENAQKCNLKPLLVFKQNHGPILAVIYWDDLLSVMQREELP